MLKLFWITGFCFSFTLHATNTSSLPTIEDELVWLSIEKDSLRATLYTLPLFPKEPHALQSFRIAIGKEKGDKLRRGDNRTPEGIYFTLSHVPEQSLYIKKYGRVAVPLDFPNLIDQMEGKTGSGIWLHGAGDDNRIAAENVTEGCVAFYNDEIVKLKNWLVPQQGIVVISKDAKQINDPQDLKEVFELTSQWIDSWSKRDLARYIDFYSNKFEQKGKSKKAYENYKSRVFKSYKNISLKTRTLRVLSHPKYAIAIMNQSFHGDKRFKSDGRKVLYWQKEGGHWKILRETFAKTSLNKLSFSEPKLQELGTILTEKP